MKTQTKMVILYCVLLLLCGAYNAQATSITFEATVTADNHYAIFTGSETSITDFIGNNETGDFNSNNDIYGYNWWYPETWTFTADSGNYIYVAAWSDNSNAQGWIGQFVSSVGTTILSNKSDWEVCLTFNDLDNFYNDYVPIDVPGINELNDKIQTANTSSPDSDYRWRDIADARDNGDTIWVGLIGGIDENADWIWGSDIEPGSGYGEYQVFRTQVPVPEPATMLLLGSGLLGAALFRRRKTK